MWLDLRGAVRLGLSFHPCLVLGMAWGSEPGHSPLRYLSRGGFLPPFSSPCLLAFPSGAWCGWPPCPGLWICTVVDCMDTQGSTFQCLPVWAPVLVLVPPCPASSIWPRYMESLSFPMIDSALSWSCMGQPDTGHVTPALTRVASWTL